MANSERNNTGTMIVRLHFLALLHWVVAGALLAAPPAAADQAASDQPSPRQIARWIDQLDADQFVTRRAATDNLIAAGRAAIAPLAKTLRDSNLEVATRGVFILRKLAVCGDVATEEAATVFLEQLAAVHSTSSSRLARDALVALNTIRQQRALDQLRDLGAKIEMRQAIVQFQRVPAVWITINSSWRGTADDLKRLKWLRDVQQITFDDPRVNDAWLAPIESLQGLQRLIIKHASISDDALRVLGKLKQLQALDIMYTPVTDACLQHLRHAATVRVMRIYGTRITPSGAERLKTALAQRAEIDYKNGAFLGVRCQQPPWPCEVVQVTRNSAAQKAGVRTSDIIVRYGKQPIRDFEDLRKQIARNKVGDRVEIQVARGGKRVVIALAPTPNGAKPLGLEGTTELYGCHVTKVKPDSVASRAGFRKNDIVVQVEEMPIQSLDALTKAYRANKTGSPLRVEVIRGVKIMTFHVTFGEWTE